jgi:molybdopterin molybdotransferase
MISVQQAEEIIQAQIRDYGTEELPFEQALGRVLAENMVCDRDMPAYNRVSMDGIAIQYDAYISSIAAFKIAGTQAAGDNPIEITNADECVEIMTGAALPASTDTIIPYEHITITDGIATITTPPAKKGQSIHYRGIDRREGDIVVHPDTLIDAAVISTAATMGKSILMVKKLPNIIIISTGDELVEVDETPSPYQLRRSNSYTLQAALAPYGIYADTMHLPDEPFTMEDEIANALNEYDVLIFSGGISMGKYDHVPRILQEVCVEQLFHKVQQRPGKPFWFGAHANGALVFAFPGNPVSAFMCLHRYFIPWFKKTMGSGDTQQMMAVLGEDVTFTPSLQYFMQVKIRFSETGQLIATPIQGNGSGDLANLLDTDAFMELPADVNEFKAGDVLRIWPFKNIFDR